MVEQVYIKPNEGRTVRLESGMLLPTEGMEVALTTYVERRILAGDAIVVKLPTEKKETKSKSN